MSFQGGLANLAGPRTPLAWRVRADGSLSSFAPDNLGDWAVEFVPAWQRLSPRRRHGLRSDQGLLTGNRSRSGHGRGSVCDTIDDAHRPLVFPRRHAVSSVPTAKFFVNQGVVTSRIDMQNLLRPLLKQTVSYRFQRGRELVAHGTGWVERIVVDDPDM